MTDDNPESAGERSLFAKILRRSADELEQPENNPDADPDADADADVEQRADDMDDEDDDGDDDGADPVDRALSEGTIEAAQASKLRDVTEKMDSAGVQTLIDAISENDLDVEDAVDMIEAYNGEGEMPAPDDGAPGSESPEELKARADAGGGDSGGAPDGPSDAEIEQLQSRLEAVDELGDRLDEIEQRLEELPTSDDVDEQVAQRLEQVGEDLDSEFEDLIQRAEVVGSPSPSAEPPDEDRTLGDVVRIGGGTDTGSGDGGD